ncbi:MAG: arginase [Phycisphaerales bacterium]|nr:arginase [Phycisphaerales bacterium]
MVIRLVGVAAGRGASTPGAEGGPRALRRAGLVERLASAGRVVEDLGDIPGVFETRFADGPARRLIHHLPHVMQVNRHLHACVLGARRKHAADFLLIIGGDHSMAIGAMAGLSDSCGRLGLLWLDAHGDFNTPESSPSGSAHGMSLAVCCGRGPEVLRGIADRDPMVREEDVFLYGCRELDPPEAKLLAGSRVHVLSAQEWRVQGVTRAALGAARDLAARCDHVHLSFDIDVMDAALVPGTGTPSRGGLSRAEGLSLLTELGRTGLVGSAEFVEYNPKLDVDGCTGALMLELIAALLGSA